LAIVSLAKDFPDYNVEFAEVVGQNTIKMRVCERGSGETLSCGTGACAVAALSASRGLVDGTKIITVKLRGGELFVEIKNGQIFLTGGAEIVFVGEIAI
jgi:diaminopimelate epimerase